MWNEAAGAGPPLYSLVMPDSPLLRHASTPIHGRYFVRPARASRGICWLVGFHGQGQTADAFMGSLERIPRGDAWLLASVQGLHRHYAKRGQEIVASWMTSQDRELAIADNVAWVDAVLDRLEAEFGAPRAIVVAGFSQGVAMAHRAALLGRRACSAVLTTGGDVPPELLAGERGPWPRVLAATGAADAWYTPARLEADAAALRATGAEVRALEFEGGHEWSDEFSKAAGELLTEVERGSSG